MNSLHYSELDSLTKEALLLRAQKICLALPQYLGCYSILRAFSSVASEHPYGESHNKGSSKMRIWSSWGPLVLSAVLINLSWGNPGHCAAYTSPHL